MKKIEYYVTFIEQDKAIDYFYDFSNSLLIKENEKFFFYSKINGIKEEVKITIKIIDFSEELVKKLEEILTFSRYKAQEISNEPIEEFLDNKIFSEIHTTVNKFVYQECKTVFYFVAELFYKYLMGHHLKNGNKRLSLMFLINTLWFFGYYLKWTKSKKEKGYKEYRSQLEEWVQQFQNLGQSKNDIMKNITLIEEWIKENVVIALNWR